jgi:hypothetical protein
VRRFLVGSFLLNSSMASACPFCAGGPDGVNDVKSAIFGSGFGMNLLAAALPFAVVIGLAWFVHGPARAPINVEGAVDGRAD